MKLLFSGRRNFRRIEADDSPETNEFLLEKENAYTTFEGRSTLFLKFVLAISITLNLVLLVIGLTQFWSQESKNDPFKQWYTPGEEVIEYRTQIFHNPIPNVEDDYAGPPTPERNEKWKDLYDIGETRLSKFEASRIHNKTAAARPSSDEDYPIILNVFHDLHCLDSIRLSLGYLRDPKWNSTYNPYTIPWPKSFHRGGDYNTGHVYHCLNGIRQSLQCFSDVTPQVYQYKQDKNKIISNFDVLHTCRNFEAIREWAIGRALTGEFNPWGWRGERGLCGPDACQE